MKVATDSNGVYTAVFHDSNPVEVVASKPGYEASDRYLGFGHGTVIQDLVLRRVVRLSPGESIRIVVDPRDSLCGLDWEWLCRTVRVTPPAGAQVAIHAVPDDPSGPVYVDLRSFVHRCPIQTAIVRSGTDVAVGLVLDWSTSHPYGYTLTASIAR